MAYSALHGRKVVHRQIKRLGGRRGAILRDGNPIPVMLRVMDYSSRDRRGDLVDPLARRALISTYAPNGSDMTTKPDKETDRIIVYAPSDNADSTDVETTLRIIAKPVPIEVAGTVIMWDLQVLE
jgi:hypothetical protein